MVAAVAAVCISSTIVGCTPTPDVVIQMDPLTRVGVPTIVATFRGYPEGVDREPFQSMHDGFSDAGTAVYADAADPRRLNVTTLGSGSCPSVPVSFSVTNDGEMAITLVSNAEKQVACTADLAPTTALVEFPDEVKIPQWVTLEHRSEFVGDDVPPRRMFVRSLGSPTGIPAIVDAYEGLPDKLDVASLGLNDSDGPSAWIYREAGNAHGLTIVTQISPSCPPVPSTYTVGDDGLLVIVLDSQSVIKGCTDDLGVYTVLMELPEDVKIPDTVAVSWAQNEYGDEEIEVQDAPE